MMNAKTTWTGTKHMTETANAPRGKTEQSPSTRLRKGILNSVITGLLASAYAAIDFFKAPSLLHGVIWFEAFALCSIFSYILLERVLFSRTGVSVLTRISQAFVGRPKK
jgi:hypothetical protein